MAMSYEGSRRIFETERRQTEAESQEVFYDPDGSKRFEIEAACITDDAWTISANEFSRPSLQKLIVENIGLQGEFHKARESAWKALFHQVERYCLGKNNLKQIDNSQKPSIALAHKIASSTAGWVDYGPQLAEKVSQKDHGFFSALDRGLEAQRSREPSAPRGPSGVEVINQITVIMAQMWVDPDFPLWLMQADPAWRIVDAFLNRDTEECPLGSECELNTQTSKQCSKCHKISVTQENYSRIKKNASLSSLKPAQITDLRSALIDGRRVFDGFSLKTDIEIPCDLIDDAPPGYIPRSSINQ